VSNTATAPSSPVIYMGNAGNTGRNVTVSGTGTVKAMGAGGTAIQSPGEVAVTGFGTVSATTGIAIEGTGTGSKATVSGGTVSNAATAPSSPVIYMGNAGNTGQNVTVSDIGTVKAMGDSGIAIQSPGNVSVSGGVVSATTGIAIQSPGNVSVTGGTVSATTGIAINATGNVSIERGSVRATAGIAINAADPSCTVTVNAGRVEATGGMGMAVAIQTAGNVRVNGGEVSSEEYAAILSTGDQSVVTVTGGKVSSLGYGICMQNQSNTGLNVTVGGTGQVEAESASTILTYGDVTIGGQPPAIDRARVSAKSSCAIDARGRTSAVTVSGGLVSAEGGHAIEALGEAARVTVNGGLVFAYGNLINGNPGTAVYIENADGFAGPTALGGMVISWSDWTWHWQPGDSTYLYGTKAGIDILPTTSATAVWDERDGLSGIAYKGLANEGFIPIAGVALRSEAAVGDVTVSGKVGAPLADSQTATIKLVGDTVKDSFTGKDVSDWFYNDWNPNTLPTGVTVAATAQKGSDSIKLTFGGVPARTWWMWDDIKERLDITIPGSVLAHGEDVPVTPNDNALFDIALEPYALTAVNGRPVNGQDASPPGSNMYLPGTGVDIMADVLDWLEFVEWVGSGGVSFNYGAGSPSNSFEMPANDATVTARYRYERPYYIEVNYFDETLTGFMPGSYSFRRPWSGEPAITVTVSGTAFPIEEGWMDWYYLSIVREGEGDIGGSEAFEDIFIPERPPAPEHIEGENETVAGLSDGRITGVDGSMEYSPDGGASWKSCTGNSVENLAPGSYQVRYAAAQGSFRGLPATIEVGQGAPQTYALKVEAPSFADVTAGYVQPDAKAITITNTGNSPATIESVTVSGEAFVISGSGGTVAPDGGKTETWKVQPEAGLGVGRHNAVITVGYDDGGTTASVVAGVTFTVNAQTNALTVVHGSGGGGAYAEGDKTGITADSAPEGQAFDRWVSDGGGAFAPGHTSSSAVFTMPAGAATVTAKYRYATPSVYISFIGEVLTGFTPGRYSFNGGTPVLVPGATHVVEEGWMDGSPLSIVREGEGDVADSAPQELLVPARPAAPISIGKTDETVTGLHDGTITGVGTDMEYKADGGATWTAGTGSAVTGLAPGVYQVRYRAAVSAFYGQPATITVREGEAQARELQVAAPSFGAATEGYGSPPAAEPIIITNNGNSLASIGSVTVSGEAFEVSGSGPAVQPEGGTIDTWKIRPKAKLGVGTYTATVTVAYDGGAQATANVGFTVNARKYAFTVANGTDTAGEGPYAAGAAVKIRAGVAPPGQVFNVWESSGGGTFLPDTSISTTFIMPDGDVTVTAKYRYATPEADIDFRSETLTGLVSGGTYSFNGAGPVVVSEAAYALAEGWMAGLPLSVVRKGEGHVADSAAQTIPEIPARPAAPDSVGKTDETIAGLADGRIAGVDGSMEYSPDGGASWKSCTGTSVDGLAPGKYQVRYAATGFSFHSLAATITVGPGVPQTYALKVEAPSFADVTAGYVQPDAKAITITNNGNSPATIESVTVSGEAFVISGSGGTVAPDGGKAETWKVQPEAGLGVGRHNAVITVGYDDGGATAYVVAGVTFTVNAQTYALTVVRGSGGGGSHAEGDKTGITADSAPEGQIFYRWVSDGGGAFAPGDTSSSAVFTMPAGATTVTAKYRYATPDAEAGFTDETLTGLVPGGVYSFNGGAPAVVSGAAYAIPEEWMDGSPLSIVRKGEGDVADSAAQAIPEIPARPAAPISIGKTDETAEGLNDGTIIGVDTDMEYKAEGGAIWTACPGPAVTGLAPGMYQVRYRATASSFHSHPATATIGKGAERTYALTVVNGTDKTGGSPYTAGTIVDIVADGAPAGKVFDKWAGGAGGAFGDESSPSTTFAMPSNAATATATYKDIEENEEKGVKPVEKDFGAYTGSGDVTAKVDADYTTFVRLLLEGEEVDAENYTVTQGSTAITLKEGYLKTFGDGTYLFVAEFSDGVSGNIKLSIGQAGDGKYPGDGPPGQDTDKPGGSAGNSTGTSSSGWPIGGAATTASVDQPAAGEATTGSTSDQDEAKAGSGAAEAAVGDSTAGKGISPLALWLAVIAALGAALIVVISMNARRKKAQ
jgi:hypothetical protein